MASAFEFDTGIRWCPVDDIYFELHYSWYVNINVLYELIWLSQSYEDLQDYP